MRHLGPHYHKVRCSASEEVTGASKSQVQGRNFPWETISLIIIGPYQGALHGVFEAGVLTKPGAHYLVKPAGQRAPGIGLLPPLQVPAEGFTVT